MRILQIKSSFANRILLGFTLLLLLMNCKTEENKELKKLVTSKAESPMVLVELPTNTSVPKGMLWIPGGTFLQGANTLNKMAMSHEKPAHKVSVDGFFMDVTEVTNNQFAKFVAETGYMTIAERKIDWEEMQQQLPAGTPKPADSILQPGSLIFKKPKQEITNLADYSQWWEWKIGANWQHPHGPDSNIKGKGNRPVVHIAYEDAMAYCKWIGHRLPTEAEWEYAASGGLKNAIYTWGEESKQLHDMANTWDGVFPNENGMTDGFANSAPVKSYPANGYGLYDMAGNVWEWTDDWYNLDYYKQFTAISKPVLNPNGAEKPYNPYNSYAKEKVLKGGSFLCNANYCASYRVSARMGNSLDSAQEHLGFRTVKSYLKK